MIMLSRDIPNQYLFNNLNQPNMITSPAASITSYNSNQFMGTSGSASGSGVLGFDFDKTQDRALLK